MNHFSVSFFHEISPGPSKSTLNFVVPTLKTFGFYPGDVVINLCVNSAAGSTFRAFDWFNFAFAAVDCVAALFVEVELGFDVAVPFEVAVTGDREAFAGCSRFFTTRFVFFRAGVAAFSDG